MTTFEIEIKAANFLEILHVQAGSEAQAILKARAHARGCMSSTAYRFATFTVC